MDEHRNAYRYVVSAGDAAAMLRTGNGEFVVQVVDESAGGWGIFCDPSIVLTEGEVVGFTTPRGPSICRVVRVEPHDEHLSVGLFRISDVMEEPKEQSSGKRWAGQFVKSNSSFLLLLAFAVGLGAAMGFFKVGFHLFAQPPAVATAKRVAVPAGPSERLKALSDNLANLDVLKSRQVIKAIGLTDGQQREIDNVVDKLVVDLAEIHIDRGTLAPETGSYMGLLMLRRAWTQVEQTMTAEQIAKWDAILDDMVAKSSSG